MDRREYGFGSDAFYAAVVEAAFLAVPSLLFTFLFRALFFGLGDSAHPDDAMAAGIVLALLGYVLAAGWTSVCAARIRWRSGSALTSLAIIGVWITVHTMVFTVGEDPGMFFYFCGFFLLPAALGYAVGSLVAWKKPPPSTGPRILGARSGSAVGAEDAVSQPRRKMSRYVARRIEERTDYPMTDDAHLTGRAKTIRLTLMWAAIAVYAAGVIWAWTRFGWPAGLLLALGLILPSRRLRRRRIIRHFFGLHRQKGWERLDEGLDTLDSAADGGEGARMASYLGEHGLDTGGADD